MKLYIAVVDQVGNVEASVIKTNTPVEMLKHIFVSATSGEFNLGSVAIQRYVTEVRDFWNEHDLHDLDVGETIHRLSTMLGESGDMEEAVLDMMGGGLTEDPQAFLTTLHKLFNGEVEHLQEVTEDQTLLLAMISL